MLSMFRRRTLRQVVAADLQATKLKLLEWAEASEHARAMEQMLQARVWRLSAILSQDVPTLTDVIASAGPASSDPPSAASAASE